MCQFESNQKRRPVPTLSANFGFLQAKTRPDAWKMLERDGGKPTDPELVKKASAQIDELCRVLEAEGVRVKRPEATRWDELGTFRTPHYEDGGA